MTFVLNPQFHHSTSEEEHDPHGSQACQVGAAFHSGLGCSRGCGREGHPSPEAQYSFITEYTLNVLKL